MFKTSLFLGGKFFTGKKHGGVKFYEIECIHFHLASVEGLFLKPKYRANILYLFLFHSCFISFPLFGVGISLPFFAKYLLILTDPGLQRSGIHLHWFVIVVLLI